MQGQSLCCFAGPQFCQYQHCSTHLNPEDWVWDLFPRKLASLDLPCSIRSPAHCLSQAGNSSWSMCLSADDSLLKIFEGSVASSTGMYRGTAAPPGSQNPDLLCLPENLPCKPALCPAQFLWRQDCINSQKRSAWGQSTEMPFFFPVSDPVLTFCDLSLRKELGSGKQITPGIRTKWRKKEHRA